MSFLFCLCLGRCAGHPHDRALRSIRVFPRNVALPNPKHDTYDIGSFCSNALFVKKQYLSKYRCYVDVHECLGHDFGPYGTKMPEKRQDPQNVSSQKEFTEADKFGIMFVGKSLRILQAEKNSWAAKNTTLSLYQGYTITKINGSCFNMQTKILTRKQKYKQSRNLRISLYNCFLGN